MRARRNRTVVGTDTVSSGDSGVPRSLTPAARARHPADPFGFATRPGGNTRSMPTHTRVRTRGSSQAGRAVALVADVLAFVIILWIVLWFLDANQGNELVNFIHDTASWLAGWSYDLFTFSREWIQVVVGYGLAAVVYVLVGHAVAGWLYRR